MAASSTFAGSSFASDTLASSNVPSLSPTIPSAQPTTQVVPGTTVIGTGSTGDVWSYTIPELTTVVGPSLSVAPTSEPAPTSAPAPTSVPVPESSLVVTNVIISGTTVTGGMETGVPWSYTIPEATAVSSFYVPISVTPAPSPSDTFAPSSMATASASASVSLLPLPPPHDAPPTNQAVLSGGIVGAIFGALFLLMFAVAGCLWLRLRRRRRHMGADRDKEKDIGVVWGQGWGSEKNNRGWRKIRPGMSEGAGTEVGSGFPVGPASDSRQDLRANPGMNGSTEVLAGVNQERGPPPRLSVQIPSPTVARMPPVASPTYPSRALYPQTHTGSDTNINANVQTRMTTSQPHDRHDPNAAPTKPPSSSTAPTGKLKRPVPPPSPFVYAPPPGDSPEPSPTGTTSTHPYPYQRPTSPPPRSFRPISPHYPSLNPPPQNVPKRLSKQRETPMASAFLRHMVRGPSLRRPRPKVAFDPPPPTSESGTATPSSVSARPNLATLPSFIRERQFARQSKAFVSGSESALFSPSPRPAQLPLHSPRLSQTPLPLASPRHGPTQLPSRLGSPYMSRSAPSLLPPHSRGAYTTSRDGFLSPPHAYGYGARDRNSQMTSTGTTRSGWTGHSRDSRMTGRSGDSRLTGRSGDSRHTGRSGESRLTGRSGGLAQIVEGEREQGTPPRTDDRRRRRERP